MTNTNAMEVKANIHNKQSYLSYTQKKWLDNVCVHIEQNDFDTCRNSYDDRQYDTLNKYRQAYNTYLWEFENC
jgi:hypothetical protein